MNPIDENTPVEKGSNFAKMKEMFMAGYPGWWHARGGASGSLELTAQDFFTLVEDGLSEESFHRVANFYKHLLESLEATGMTITYDHYGDPRAEVKGKKYPNTGMLAYLGFLAASDPVTYALVYSDPLVLLMGTEREELRVHIPRRYRNAVEVEAFSHYTGHPAQPDESLPDGLVESIKGLARKLQRESGNRWACYLVNPTGTNREISMTHFDFEYRHEVPLFNENGEIKDLKAKDLKTMLDEILLHSRIIQETYMRAHSAFGDRLLHEG